MRISHKHKLIFLSNPQCREISIRKALDPYSEVKGGAVPFQQSINARRLKAVFDERGWNWSEYRSFTTMRNPWDRVVALYEYGRKWPESIWAAPAAGSFKAFVRSHVLDDVFLTGNHPIGAYNIAAFTSDDSGRIVSDVLPIEQLDKLLPPLLKECGITITRIPNIDPPPKDYWVYYEKDDVAVERVGKLFASDVEIGGYRFNG